MANKYYLRTVAEMRDFSTIEDVLDAADSILTENADSPDLISGGLHIYPATVIMGSEPVEWARPYAPPPGQAAPAPDQPDTDVFSATHKHKKTGGLYRLIGFATHTEDEQDVAIYQGEDGRLWARPKSMFEDGRFEELADNV